MAGQEGQEFSLRGGRWLGVEACYWGELEEGKVLVAVEFKVAVHGPGRVRSCVSSPAIRPAPPCRWKIASPLR
jgi:hypothetical protein